jgi:hypothetical protein
MFSPASSANVESRHAVVLTPNAPAKVRGLTRKIHHQVPPGAPRRSAKNQKKRASCEYRPAKIKRTLSINLFGQNL